MSAVLVGVLTCFTVAGVGVVLAGRLRLLGRAERHGRTSAPLHHVRLTRRGRARAVEAAWPDAIDVLLLTISAGYLPIQAFALVADLLPAPVSDAFAAVSRRCAAGERFADAVQSVTDELGPLAGPLVDGLAMADRYGLPLGPVLSRLGDEARHHRRRAGEARARQLPVRLAAPMVVCTLPSFVLLAIAPLLIGAFSSLRR